MADDDLTKVLVCMPVDEADTRIMVPGATQHRAECGHLVYMSPSSVKTVAEDPSFHVRCHNCVDAEDAATSEILPAGAQELSELVGLGNAMQAITLAMNDPKIMVQLLQARGRFVRGQRDEPASQ